jgi:hypothetical protein
VSCKKLEHSVFSDMVAIVSFVYAMPSIRSGVKGLQPVQKLFSCSVVYIMEFIVSLQVIDDTLNFL